MKNISLGQYYPTGSVIHRLDGRVKLILAIIYIVSSFLCKSLASFSLLMLGTLVLVLITKIPISIILRSLKAVVFILIITFAINTLVLFVGSENISKIMLLILF